MAHAYQVVCMAIEMSGLEITEVVSGAGGSVDVSGERWAAAHDIHVTQFIPDWDKFGTGAGPIRNQQMAKYAEALIAVWDGRSHGTRDMIGKAKRLGLTVKVYLWTPKGKNGATKTGRPNSRS